MGLRLRLIAIRAPLNANLIFRIYGREKKSHSV